MAAQLPYDNCALLIQKAGNKIGCSCVVIAKALMIYHHFRHVTAEMKYNDFTISAAVLDTSIFKNTGKNKYKDVILAIQELMGCESPPSEEEMMDMKENFSLVQFFVMQTLEFNIDYVVAYSFAELYLSVLQDRPEFNSIWANFRDFVWMFISEFYLNKRCLRYPAQEIAFGCITLAAKVLAVNLSDMPSWTQEVSVHMDSRKQDDLMDDLIYVLDSLDDILRDEKK